jgi:hypothetical protein
MSTERSDGKALRDRRLRVQLDDLGIAMTPGQILGGFVLLAGVLLLLRRRGKRGA